MKVLKISVLLCALAWTAGPLALPVQCSTGPADAKEAKARCRANQGNSAFYPTLVSVDELLGFNLWLPDENMFYSEQSARTGLGLTGKQVEGVWAIDNLRALLVDGMMIHASGADRERMMAYVRPLPGAVALTLDTDVLLSGPTGAAGAAPTDRPLSVAAVVAPEPSSDEHGDTDLESAPPAPPAVSLPAPAAIAVPAPDEGDEFEGEYDSDCDDEVCPDEPMEVAEPPLLALFAIGALLMGWARRLR